LTAGVGAWGFGQCKRDVHDDPPCLVALPSVLQVEAALHDGEPEKSLVILYFETEDDYRRGDEMLNALPGDEHQGGARR
jgi:hypothetical protein